MTDEDEPERTVFRPAPPPQPPAPTPASTPMAAVPGTAWPAAFVPMAPRAGEAHIQVGDMLNHIFEVKRFIARGGMGEVFEGSNVASDERVAIKVMLPALAADPNIQAMFRKEARTLTRLSHPALVAYRVLAQEPQLGVLYIVTEYIDGANLSDVLGTLSPSPAELLALTRRLADGLRAAHALGAIHRDMSPDNVLLEDGKLAQARIIDFGIAKDVSTGAKTIIGDGFAGKLGYVAPEQLGDFDGEVGAWSDVYSLGLVVLAVSLGRNVDMGTTFADALRKRRQGADITAAPEQLRSVLERMLKPDPAERLRSMDEVIAMIDASAAFSGRAGDRITPSKTSAPPRREPPATTVPAGSPARETGGNRTLIVGGGIGGAILLLAIGGFLAFGGRGHPQPGAVAPPPAGAMPAQNAVEVARNAVSRTLPELACTWLDIIGVKQSADGIDMGFTGVAGDAAFAEASISKAVTAAGVPVGSADFGDVAGISNTECNTIDALRAIRSIEPPRLSVPQRSFEMSRLGNDSNYGGQIGARSIINIDLGNGLEDFAMYGIEPNGAISALVANRKDFDTIPKTGTALSDLGGGHYRLQIDSNHSGWSGIILLTGKGGFSDKLVVAGPGVRTDAWRRQFAAAAAAGGWKSEMVWYKDVDEVPN